mmetsp:Transcript_129922/g.323771  ORF Transcript_129922/g.323771 Transcript_129922/m.323771 type:complete len:214 (+) Transcript_129922:165-806(+)
MRSAPVLHLAAHGEWAGATASTGRKQGKRRRRRWCAKGQGPRLQHAHPCCGSRCRRQRSGGKQRGRRGARGPRQTPRRGHEGSGCGGWSGATGQPHSAGCPGWRWHQRRGTQGTARQGHLRGQRHQRSPRRFCFGPGRPRRHLGGSDCWDGTQRSLLGADIRWWSKLLLRQRRRGRRQWRVGRWQRRWQGCQVLKPCGSTPATTARAANSCRT